MTRVLLLEGDTQLAAGLRKSMPELQFLHATRVADAWEFLGEDPDVVLCNVHLPEESGLDFAEALKGSRPRLPVIVMSAFGDMEQAIRALRVGAWDFLTIPMDIHLLRSALDRAVETHRLRREVLALKVAARALDCIGDKLVEVNVCAPGGLQDIGRMEQRDFVGPWLRTTMSMGQPTPS